VSDTQDKLLGTRYGIGVDENTALLVTSDLDGSGKMGEVIGEAGVYFVDVGSSEVTEINR
jgi:cyanophycinase-like exopeptidase